MLTPLVEAAYQQELALYERCRESAECLEARSRSVQQALAEEPDAIALHRIHQFVEQSRGDDAKQQLGDHYKQQMEARGRGMDVYLYARLVDDPAEKQSLMERAAKLDPMSPWPHEALAWLARRGNQLPRAQEHLKKFLSHCPSRVESSYRRWTEAIEDSGFWLEVWGPAVQQAERAALEGSSPKLVDLWRTELMLTDGARHPEALARMGKVLQNIEAQGREDDATWWTLLQQGYGLVGNEARQRWAVAGLRALEPCSEAVTNAAVRDFWKQAPMERPDDSPEKRRALLQERLRTGEAWLEACPQSWPYRSFHFGARVASEEISVEELAQLFETTRRRTDIPYPHQYPFAIHIGRTSLERGVLLERRDDWLSRELDQMLEEALRSETATLNRSPGAPTASRSGPHHDLAATFTDSSTSTMERALGKALPPFELRDLNGEAWNLQRLEGRTVFMNVWTSTCLFCRAAFPWVDQLHRLTAERDDLQVLTLSADGSQSHASAFIQEKGYSFPVVVSDAYAYEELGVAGVPVHYLIGPDGIIVDVTAGFGQQDGEAWLAETLEKMEAVAQAPAP